MPLSPTLQRLLETQRQPFLILDAECRVAGINSALKRALGDVPDAWWGKTCCCRDIDPEPTCRHQTFFRDLEPYVEIRTLNLADGSRQNVQAQGFPLMDFDGTLYLGESLRFPESRPDGGDMVGRSNGIEDLRRLLTQAGSTDVPVLLRGETGSGKELAAQYLHRHSSRADEPFVVVDCTVLNEDLFESELFGHVKGAFTGAAGDKTGLFELADKGTLFLDEVGELPLSQQPKLLRALESGTFRRVGATDTRRSDVRVVSATHQDLEAHIRAGGFRQDLFYRLAVLPLPVPPLRERREDVPELAERILQQISESSGRPHRLNRDALIKLLSYHYPGNIRELRNLLHLAATLSGGEEITAEDIQLPESTTQPDEPSTNIPTADFSGLSPVEAAEAGYILELMQRHNGSRKQVAAGMNVSERTLYRKLKRYGLNKNHD